MIDLDENVFFNLLRCVRLGIGASIAIPFARIVIAGPFINAYEAGETIAPTWEAYLLWYIHIIELPPEAIMPTIVLRFVALVSLRSAPSVSVSSCLIDFSMQWKTNWKLPTQMKTNETRQLSRFPRSTTSAASRSDNARISQDRCKGSVRLEPKILVVRCSTGPSIQHNSCE